MVFDVVVSSRAEGDLNRLIDANLDRYTRLEQRAYVMLLRQRALELRERADHHQIIPIDGVESRRLRVKAHNIYYRVDRDRMRVTVVAVLHVAMDAAARLSRS